VNELPLRHVTVDGAKIAFVEAGPKDGEVVVFIHGYPQSHYMWRHQIPELAKTHRVIAVDWFGWGESERVLTQPVGYDAEVERIGKLLDALDIERCNLVAHDYGGYISIGFVLAHPDRVLRFAILNSRAHDTFNRSGFWACWLVATTSRTAPGLLAALPLEKIHRLGLEPYEQAGIFDKELVERYVGWMGEPANRRWFARFFAGYRLRPRRHQLEALAKLEIPTAVIWGDADPWCPPEIGHELAATIPGAVETRIRHGMHFIAEHKPVEVTASIQALLAREPANAGLEAPLPPDPIPFRRSKYYREAILAAWCWTVCAALVALGLLGLFVEELGPVRTNHAHALALNLGVGLLGFSFARFALEHVFVLVSGLGMVALGSMGFYTPTQTWLYETFNLTNLSSTVEIVTGVISLLIYVAYRPRSAR
jgi:pimeloyl-ACP methyl ester carboxylesterase